METDANKSNVDQTAPNPPASSPPPPVEKKPFPLYGWIIIAAFALLVIIAITRGIASHHRAETVRAAEPTVAVVIATRGELYNEMTIPAEFRPYVEVELHAKVSGYLEKMNVDFGDKVKSGQLLATIEVPELSDQLDNALAMQRKAEVDYTNANLMYSRLQSVNEQHSNLVAQQDLDNAQSKNFAAVAAIAGAKAEVERYQTLVRYTKITAPFDGIITHRYADPGTLIQAGTSGGQSLPILRISDNYHLRLDFPVSVKYVKDIQPDQLVDVKVESLGGKKYLGKVTRFTDRVNDETRTMMTETEVTNLDLEIVPGMYAEVVLKVERRTNAVIVPVQAVGGEKDTLFVVNKDGEIELRQVKLGLETPEKVEVISGVHEGEQVMIGNRTLVHPGQKVETKEITEP